MNRKNIFCQLLTELAQTFNLNIPVSQGNHYTLTFESDINLSLYFSDEKQLIHAAIQFLEVKQDQLNNKDFYQMLLRLQFLGHGTHDCFFGMGNNNQNIYLFKNFNVKEIGVSDFSQQITQLINVFKKCREKFEINDLPMSAPTRNIPNREFRMLV